MWEIKVFFFLYVIEIFEVVGYLVIVDWYKIYYKDILRNEVKLFKMFIGGCVIKLIKWVY